MIIAFLKNPHIFSSPQHPLSQIKSWLEVRCSLFHSSFIFSSLSYHSSSYPFLLSLLHIPFSFFPYFFFSFSITWLRLSTTSLTLFTSTTSSTISIQRDRRGGSEGGSRTASGVSAGWLPLTNYYSHCYYLPIGVSSLTRTMLWVS